MIQDFQSSWKEYIDGITRRNLLIAYIIGILLLLAFIALDYYQTGALFYRFLILRVLSSSFGVILIVLFLKRKIGILTFGYLAFCIPGALLVYFCTLLKGEALFIYNINFSSAFILYSFLFTWGWRHTLNIVIIFNVVYASFLCSHDLTLKYLISSGLLITTSSSFICVVVCGIRYAQIKREFKLRFKLQKLIFRLNTINNTVESKNRELSLFGDIIENSSDGIIIMDVDVSNYTIAKIVHKNLNFDKLRLFAKQDNLSDYLKLFRFKNLPYGENGLVFLLDNKPNNFQDTYEINFKNTNDENIIAEISFLTLKNTNSLKITITAFIRDVTIKKNLEKDQIKQSLRNYLFTINSVNVAQEKERERFATDLHDGLGQVLTSIKMNLAYLFEVIEKKHKSLIHSSIESLNYSINEMRSIAYGIASPALIQFGLLSALKELCSNAFSKSSTRLSFTTNINENSGRFSKVEEINLYRIIQEALNNILKHSQASLAEVTLYKIGTKYLLRIWDNGKGFNKSEIQHSFGLNSIRARCDIIGAKYSIKTISGTTIDITFSKK